MTRTIAIGLDGCSWNVLEPLLETGQLPHLQELAENGARGVLESTIPFFTGPAWASFATGCSPAAHGIYDFMMMREGGKLSVARQSDLRRTTYYEQLGREGKRCVLINLPLDQDGCEGAVIVNSWLTDDDERRILPVGRRERYARLLEAYRTFPSTRPADRERQLEELLEIEQSRFDLARELFLGEQWDHFFVLFSSTDWIGHAGTGLVERGDEDARIAFLRLYKRLDDYIGWFRERAGDATVIILSDHGQVGETHVVRVNAPLRDLGLVELAAAERPEDSPFFAVRKWRRPRATIRVPEVVSRYRGNRMVRPAALLAKRVLRRGLNVHLSAPAHQIDRARSRAFSPTDASFAIYGRDLSAEELTGIREALLAIRIDDDRPAIEGVWTVDELYGHSAGPDGPALLFSPADGVRPSAAIRDRVIDFPVHQGSGCHKRDGIVMIGGADALKGDIGRASIYDLTPTILWAMESGIPSGCDGRVLYEAFDPAVADKRPYNEVGGGDVEREQMAEEDPTGEVTRRLKALGYI